MKSTRLLAAAAALAISAATLTASLPAQASATLTSVKLSSSSVVLDGNAGCANRINVSLLVTQPAGEQFAEYTSATAVVVGPTGDNEDYLFMPVTATSGNVTTYSDGIFLCGYNAPGRYTMQSEVSWYDGTNFRSQQRSNQFYVNRPTTLSYNASPEPAKRGAKLTHSGQLMFDRFGYGAFYGPKGVKLTLSFKKSGTSAFVVKATIATGASGKFAATFKTDADGTWRLTYPGSAYYQSQIKDDYVDTK